MSQGTGALATLAPLATSANGLSPAARHWLAAALLALFALQVFVTSLGTSPAYDEVVILPAGYIFLRTGQWQVIPEHPPLIAALSALPLLLLEPRLDLTDPLLSQLRPNPWNVGQNFLGLNNDDDRLFFWGRLPVLLLAVLLGFFVYRWAQALYGGASGLMALLLYAFCPAFVAHSGFVSHDVGMAVFFTLALYALWRFMTEGTWLHLLWAGLLLGCALASKGSAIALVPAFAALMLLAVRWPPARARSDGSTAARAGGLAFPLVADAVRRRLVLSSAALGVIFLMAFAVLYIVYLFPADPLVYLRTVVLGQTVRSPNYLFYLFGHFRTKGWWYYFLAAYLVKTPIPMLLLIPLACWHWRRERAGWFREVFLLLPAVSLFVLVSTVAYPIGIRYLLPAYPLLFVFVSRTAPLFTRSRLGVAAAVVLTAWYVSTPLRFHPDYLAYFNELVGGPKHGIQYLDDSSIEWGQHLKRIKRYLDEHRLENVKLAYFTTGRPEYYGISAPRIPLGELPRTLEPGTYVVGAYDLVRVRAAYGIDWLEQYDVVDRIGYSVYVLRVR